jgi:hypothetical protein
MIGYTELFVWVNMRIQFLPYVEVYSVEAWKKIHRIRETP